jgi:hypothetical protein
MTPFGQTRITAVMRPAEKIAYLIALIRRAGKSPAGSLRYAQLTNGKTSD